MRSFSSAFCSSESLFTPTCCRHDRLHGDGAGPPQHPPVNWQIKYIHSISCTSARATGDKIKSSQDRLPVGACLFQNGFYVAPEFSCVTGCKEVGFRNSILPKRWSCGNHPLLPPSCHGSSKSMRGLVVQGNLVQSITLQPSPLSYLRIKLLLLGRQGWRIWLGICH